MNLHQIKLKEFYKILATTPNGLTELSAKTKLDKIGLNQFSEPKKTPIILRFMQQFKNFFSMLLLTGSLLSIIGEYLSPGEGSIYVGYVLFGVTVLNAIFTFIQAYKAEKAMEAFKNLLPKRIIVIRDNKEKEIDTKYLVPGDLILLKEGDKIPADARIIESNLLKVDHSALTGESEPQLRSTISTSKKILNSRNMVFSGTLIQSGSGKAIITNTGDRTEMGKIANLTKNIKETKSKIEKELSYFIKIISIIAIILGISFFFMGFIVGRTFWESLVFAIGIIVANVPEGLLPTVTFTLSIAAKKMAKNNAFVKDMESIETLGSITTICTDKTGTLTQNIVTVTGIYIDNKEYTTKTIKNTPNLKNLYNCMTLCNNANQTNKTGDPTELALLEFCHIANYPRLFEIPFDSERKNMITVNKVNNKKISYMKGATEIVINKCKKITIGKRTLTLTASMKKNIISKNKDLSSKGLRVLAFAYKTTPSVKEKELEKNDYTFIALVSMRDPPRKEVPKAIKLCKEAGIRVIIISGDHPVTVEAISKEIGLFNNPLVLTGELIAKMSDIKLKKLLNNKEIIFARALPKDKLRVVYLLQQKGEIVAVTGDGVNDAPALKKADVGISMGKCGTDVAKEASNIILLDDNFATIVKAIKSGRTIYDNIKSFIIYILTSNTPEILPFIFFVLFGWPLALPVLLILAIDLGTDMVPAISLGIEKSEADIMKNKPRDPNARLLTWKMLFRSYGIIGPIQTLTAYIIFFMVLNSGGWNFGSKISITSPLYLSAVTAFFTAIVITQIFNLISCRTIRTSAFKKSFKNKIMYIGIIVEIMLVLALIFVPFLSKSFGTHPFQLKLVIFMIVGGISILAIEETRKFLYRKYGILSVY